MMSLANQLSFPATKHRQHRYAMLFKSIQLLLITGATLITPCALAADVPSSGLWWNPAKPGRGFTIDTVDNKLVVISYAYTEDGVPEWTMASGAIDNDSWSRSLQRFSFNSAANAITSERVGQLRLTFNTATSATLKWTINGQSGSEPIELFSDRNNSTAQNGLWFTPALNGTGFTFFNKDQKFGAVHYFYDSNGLPVWALGVTDNNTANRQQLAMDTYTGGACLACAQQIPTATSVGLFDVSLQSAVHGVGKTSFNQSSPLSINTQQTFQPLVSLAQQQQAELLANGGDASVVAANALSRNDISKILSQAVSEASARSARATIAVVDRVGNVLAVYRMNGANTNVTISTQRTPPVTTGLEGISLDGLDGVAAISKAVTGAYLSSTGNAFTTRTANQIVQEHFNPQERGQPSGPLFGVQFSQLPCSDLSARFNDDGLVGPKRSPFGLAADAGGLPLFKGGVVVGGIGVIADGIYGVDARIIDVDFDLDELISLAATFGFEPPNDRRADRITVEGKVFRYTDASFKSLRSKPADAPALAAQSGSLIAVRGYTGPTLNNVISINPGTIFETAASGIRRDNGQNFPDQEAFVLVDAFDQPRFAPKAGQNLGAGEVQQILSSALAVADRARAQIRRPLNTPARVTISVVDVNGDILGVARSPDAPMFGTDVSLQKARTAAFFSSADAGSALLNATDAAYLGSATRFPISSYVTSARDFLQDPDALTGNIAFSDRAGGNLSRPFFPDGLNRKDNGPFSKPFVDWSPFSTGLQLDLVVNGVLSHVVFALGLVADDIGRSCTDVPTDTLVTLAGVAGIPLSEFTVGTPVNAVANGIQIFPGSVPIYKGGQLVGGIGVSGDGVDQDDLIAFLGLHNAGLQLGSVNNAPAAIRADQLTPKGVRLRYVQCPINPFRDRDDQNVCHGK